MKDRLKKFLLKIQLWARQFADWFVNIPRHKKEFLLENIGLSTIVHLIVVAMLLTSFIFATDDIVVAPERMKIIDIDLSSVKITRDKTIVAGDVTPVNAAKEVGQGESNEKVVEKKPIQPNKVMMVNRTSAPLNRTMTVSVTDALRVAMTRCWHIDSMRPGLENVRIVAHMSLSREGRVNSVWFDEESRNDSAFLYALDTVKMAISVCQPFSMLPTEMYDVWSSVRLTFYPATGSIQ